MNARDLLALLLALGTFRSWDADPVDVRPDPAYAADLAEARRKTGLDESVITGEGLLGFLGPRVYQALYGSRFPDGIQTAENLHAHGLIDALVAPGELATVLDRVLPLRPAAT